MTHPPRLIIAQVEPEIDEGRFPIKRTIGEEVLVRATIFADGHDKIAAVVRYRHVAGYGLQASGYGTRETDYGLQASGYSLPEQRSLDPAARFPEARSLQPEAWHEVTMKSLGNDRWEASFRVAALGRYEYTIDAWIDRRATWEDEVSKKKAAGQDVSSELLEGVILKRELAREEARLKPGTTTAGQVPTQVEVRSGAATYERTLTVWVERERARCGAWYEMFPRSAGLDPTRSATFDEAAARLPAIAAMGFDVLYLPPIHPIARTSRKGRNNSLAAEPNDPGSPWAIGSDAGGHTAVEPALGTIDDFDRFVAAARAHGLEIALDIAFQASPDHPWVREHPEWFRHRPDGSIKYAENPPKKYQDIYPFNFESPDWESLWRALLGILRFWIDHGVRIFRVDNPHTKPLRFWEWVIREIRSTHLDVILLSEAFTRPAVMKYLAKLGFTQSYTYFTWRNTKRELVDYFTELTETQMREYFRPNLFANTPDILHAYLQNGGRPAFQVRLVLAATLGASYGIYSGFELCENRAAAPGSEEYFDSEKYQIVHRDWDRPGHIKDLVQAVNRIRNENPALQFSWPLAFHETDNDQLMFYSRKTPDDSNALMIVVNLDPDHVQHGWVKAPLYDWHLPLGHEFIVRDLLSGEAYRWRGEWNYVRLDPTERVAHILRMEKE
ncbi:MAG: alpha-1,4-glucan--maltose-1-phosphate maltosyltransferase [Acidobacteria bacterium]|nr:alpha-1,4-glucan--maltose-1-phosphate maltosyltransferase [Acidobacteriota bacterium]